MIITTPYTPIHSVEWLEDFFAKNYYKKPYDRFKWWRKYTSKTKPLSTRVPLADRILNGDFDIGSYGFEAELVEHTINDKYVELYNDQGRYVFCGSYRGNPIHYHGYCRYSCCRI